jgi:cytochrome b6-f complex iron-sulfur subunit
VYVAAGRLYVTAYPASALPNARHEYAGAVLHGMEAGVVALYQKCVHLGCRVPWCSSSQWFECPCHASQYDRVGERRSGPAPRGLDRFGVSVDDGILTVDTSKVVLGPPVGTSTTGQEAEGPHCAD